MAVMIDEEGESNDNYDPDDAEDDDDDCGRRRPS